MGYYMRFVLTEDSHLDLPTIESALQAHDSQYHLQIEEGAKTPSADLYFGNDLYAELEINRPGDGTFDEELEELLEFLEDAGDGARQRVEESLSGAKAIIAVRVLWQDRDTEETLDKIDPLWVWLFETREGLLQADGEGYYDRTGLVLSVE